MFIHVGTQVCAASKPARRVRSAAWLMIGLSIAGCDRAKPDPRTAADSKSAAANQPRVIPSRIITIAPSATEMIVTLGAGERLVGVSDFCRVPDSMALVPRVGGLVDPNLELILRLKPDLVIIRGQIREVEALCAANGIRLYRDPTESYEDVFQTIHELGNILGREAEAAKLAGATRDRIDRVARAVAGRPRPRVLFTTDRPADSLSRVTTCGRGTFVDEIIRKAGGESIFGTMDVAYPEVSLEAIVNARPEVIIEVMPGVKEDGGTLSKRLAAQWKGLGPLPAAENGRIHVFTDAELVVPSPRIADSIERLARVFHPEATIE